jgi:hypothetical protein
MSESSWKVIPGFPAYEANPNGNVRNANRMTLMQKFQCKSGYERLTLRKEGKYVSIDVHRLIALTFIGNADGKLTVNHKNRIKNDNRVENLEWATYSEQNRHVHETNKTHERNTCKYSGVHFEPHENEEWKDIPDTDYEINNYGYVRNKVKGTYRVLAKDARGYVSICLHDKSYSIHRSVAKAFIPQFTEKCVVNHIDGNKSNNYVTNLECVTQSQNIQHAYKNNLINKRKKIRVKQYNENGLLVGVYESLAEAEAKTGINRGCIHHAIHAERSSKGFLWKRD